MELVKVTYEKIIRQTIEFTPLTIKISDIKENEKKQGYTFIRRSFVFDKKKYNRFFRSGFKYCYREQTKGE